MIFTDNLEFNVINNKYLLDYVIYFQTRDKFNTRQTRISTEIFALCQCIKTSDVPFENKQIFVSNTVTISRKIEKYYQPVIKIETTN